jgi:predicted Co/Zn/Cd cation transporter (cation efflux family)
MYYLGAWQDMCCCLAAIFISLASVIADNNILLPLPLLLLLLPLQVSQVVIAYADWQMRREDPRFPVGQARLEAIGVLACEGFRVLLLLYGAPCFQHHMIA